MKNTNNTNRLIADYQRPAFEQLMQIVQTVKTMGKYQLSIAPRTNCLITGPTGVGKSKLVSLVAAASGARLLGLSALEWMPMGAAGKGAEITWLQIANFLNREGAQSKHTSPEDEPFLIIFLDELDKLCATENAWQNYIRTECFKLLDHQIPEGLKDEYDEGFSAAERIKLQYVLEHRTLILAAGAFQSHREEKSRASIGFANASVDQKNVGLPEVTETLSREITNRFRTTTIRLPELVSNDYENILLSVAEDLPEHLQVPFLMLGRSRIDVAVEQKTGFRFVEEVLLDAIMMEHLTDPPKTLVWKRYPPNSHKLQSQYYDPRDTPEIL